MVPNAKLLGALPAHADRVIVGEAERLGGADAEPSEFLTQIVIIPNPASTRSCWVRVPVYST